MESTSSVDRPHLDDIRSMSYNRVTVSKDLKNTIMAQIADSSESLPLWESAEYDGDHEKPVADTTNVATPKLEKGNPMEQLNLDKHKTAEDSDHLEVPGQSGHHDKDRPGTLRRLTTKIKKTMSNTDRKKAPSPASPRRN